MERRRRGRKSLLPWQCCLLPGNWAGLKLPFGHIYTRTRTHTCTHTHTLSPFLKILLHLIFSLERHMIHSFDICFRCHKEFLSRAFWSLCCVSLSLRCVCVCVTVIGSVWGHQHVSGRTSVLVGNAKNESLAVSRASHTNTHSPTCSVWVFLRLLSFLLPTCLSWPSAPGRRMDGQPAVTLAL